MSSTELAWRPLPFALSSALPALLVAVQMDTTSYTVRVTDMANIWAEGMDRKSICMRGWNENTSIDPSDTPENMARFLACLSSALDVSYPGHDDTSIALTRAAASDAGQDGLTLRVTCALPGLAALKWPIHLRKCPSSAIATQLVLPLIQAHHIRKQEVKFLLKALAQKDSVLTKLSDKLEAMGTGLEHVFTALSGRKKVSRSTANDKVKGLAPFDQRNWRGDMSHDMDDPKNTSDLFQSVFEDADLRYGPVLNIDDDSPALDMWWRDFNDTLPVGPSTQTRPTRPSESKTSPPVVPATAEEDDDDFQVQATPPRLRASDAVAGAVADKGSSARGLSVTDSEDEPSLIPDSNPPPAVSASVWLAETGSLPPSRLGTIGGMRQATTSPPAVLGEKIPAEMRSEQPVDDSETASEGSGNDDDATASIPDSVTSPLPSKKPMMSSTSFGLGRIGGGNPGSGDALANEFGEANLKEHGEATAPEMLGVIGNKTNPQRVSFTSAPESDRGRASLQKEAEKSPARDTSQERADRRREALKRDLEMKATAVPVRKKRRF